MKIKYFLALICATATLLFTSCDDDSTRGLPTTDVSIKSSTGIFEVVHQKTLKLIGVVNSNIPSTYLWTIDGVAQSTTDTILNFTGISVGEHVVTFSATNEFGRSTATATIYVSGKFKGGAFILNEGSASTEGGSFIHIGYDGIVTPNAQYVVNGFEFGINPQQMFWNNGKIYVGSKEPASGNYGHRLTVLNAETLEEIADYTADLNAINYLTAYHSAVAALGNDIFLTTSSTNQDLRSFNTVTKDVTLIKNGRINAAHRMYASRNKLFAINGNFVKVFEEGKDTITTQIDFGAAVRSIARASDGNLFVAVGTSPIEIRKMNTSNYSIMNTSTLPTSITALAGSGQAIQQIWPKGDTIYFYTSSGTNWIVYEHITTSNLTNTVENIYPYLPYTMLYGGTFGVSPKTGQIYIATFAGYGTAYRTNSITVFTLTDGDGSGGADRIRLIEDYYDHTRFTTGVYFPESYE
jgi:hypothetical protein